MTKELDAGNIIYQEQIALDSRETYRSLYDKLTNLSYNVLRKHIHKLFNNQVESKQQNNDLVTIAKNISRDDEKIEWSRPAKEVEAKIRGLYDEPIAYSIYEGVIVKIYEAEINEVFIKGAPGEILTINPTGMTVACGVGCVKITKLQLAGKNPISIKEMLNGNHIFKLKTSFNY
jgi:methionyl-tRNA formyltransferase